MAALFFDNGRSSSPLKKNHPNVLTFKNTAD
jgi:hypothetical protein